MMGSIVSENSGMADALYVTESVYVALFPAASHAVMVISFAPLLRLIPVIDQLVVPVALPDSPVASFDQVIKTTPVPSEAEPPRLMVEEDVL